MPYVLLRKVEKPLGRPQSAISYKRNAGAGLIKKYLRVLLVLSYASGFLFCIFRFSF